MLTLKHYWRNTTLFSCNIPQYMPRNRFELLLSVLHFSDNNTATSNNRLFKIQPLIDLLVNKFNAARIPDDSVCIDESMVPFSGRLLFKYLNNTMHLKDIAMILKFLNCALLIFILQNIKFMLEKKLPKIHQLLLKWCLNYHRTT